MEKTGKNAEEVLNTLNKESGLLGISGTSSDLRDIIDEAKEGKERAQLALDVFAFVFINTLVHTQHVCMV
ncbi:hypothetical protein J4710_03555 [Staphylococcus xylosus]|uniref:Uncharacterized protein n=1 Tax=Staphylococcus xylosus TaxID=1288 RepID=A0A939SRZ8_STAXY|nr:hypothetical protein [Staphylococcus xylosus]